MEKDAKIKCLSTTVQELKHSNNEEVQKLNAEVKKMSDRLDELKQRELTLSENQRKFEAEKKKDKERRLQFEKDQQAEYKQKLDLEKERLVKDNALSLEHEKKKSADFQTQLITLREKKAETDKTLKLYVKDTKELELRVRDYESRYPVQSLSTEH